MPDRNMVFMKFWEDLEKSFAEDAMKILLLVIMVSIYPLLARLGFSFVAPLVIQVNEEKYVCQLAEILRGFDELKMISLSAQPSKIREYLKEFNYGKIFFVFGEGRYTEENLTEIISACENISGNISEISLKIVMTASRIPQKYRNKFDGFLFVNGINLMAESLKKYDITFIREIIIFSTTHVKEIQYGGRKQVACVNGSEEVIKIAAEVLRLYLKTLDLRLSEIKEWEKRINDSLKKIEGEWEDTDDPEMYGITFRKALYSLSREFMRALDRRHVPEEYTEYIEKSLIYDNKFYYISHDFFVKVCECIGVKGNEINYFKEQLANADVIAHEGIKRCYYAPKIDIVTVYGIKKYRMIKIMRKKIDEEYGLSLQEEIEQLKGDENSGECKIGENTLPEPSDNSAELG